MLDQHHRNVVAFLRVGNAEDRSGPGLQQDELIDGRQVVADGRMLTLDQNDAADRLDRTQRRMLEAARQDYRGRSAAEISPLSLPLAD
jgi:hypothetical protein